MTHESFREQLPLYVLGALDGEELREFERYVAANRGRCEGEIAEYQAVANQIALSAPPAKPPTAVFDRVLASIEAQGIAPARAVETKARETQQSPMSALLFRWIPWTITAVLCVAL